MTLKRKKENFVMGHKQSTEQKISRHMDKKSEIYTISGRGKKRPHRYKESVILFRQKIVDDIIPSQILPHLHFLSDADRSAIRAEQDQHKAVELILDKITASDDPGKWKTFVQAIEQCGFKAVANVLKLLPVPDSSNQRNTLHLFSPRLREMITPSEITAELLSREVITSVDMEEIHQIERNAGPIAAADLLLDRIPRKNPFWFIHFLQALGNIDRNDLILMLSDGSEDPENRKKEMGVSIANGQPIEVSTGTGRDMQNTERKDEHESDENSLTEECTYGLLYDERKRENSYSQTNLGKESVIYTREKKLMSPSTATRIDTQNAEGEIKDESRENCETEECIFVSSSEISRGNSRLQTKLEKKPEICLNEEILTSQNLHIRIKEKKVALISENGDLECALEEYKEYLKALERNVELRKMIKGVCEKIQEKEEDVAAVNSCKLIFKDLTVRF